ncbi:MAG: hypothetical protein IRY91_17020, partial [Gemmatimonadaceae bacterium]|nr:hypothetical protein [Gemmatimonadaceae bacterium]
DQTATVGTSVAQEIETIVTLSAAPSVSSGGSIFLNRAAGSTGVSAMRLWGPSTVGSWSGTGTLPNGCPSLNPANPEDGDHDGVPTSITMTFANPPCSVTLSGGATLSLTGALAVTDPEPADSGLAFSATATNLSVALTNAAQTQSISETHNGGWSASASAEGLSVDYNITTTIAATGQPGTTIVNAWTAAFTPDVGQSLFMGHALPPGLLTASGALNVTHATDAFALTLTTTTPLHYDPETCNGGLSQFTSGEVHAAVTGTAAHGYVRIVWHDCATPTYTFIATNA